MIFSRIIAGVDQSIRRSTRKPRLNHDENRWTKSASTAREILAVIDRIEQLLAHAHQRGGAAGRKIEAAQQLLPARLGGVVHLGRGLVGRRGLPGLDGGVELAPCPARSGSASASKNAMRGPVVSSAYLARISLASATPDASPRPDSNSSHSSTRLSDRAAGASRRSRARSSSARPRSRDAVKHFAEKGRVHFKFSPVPHRTSRRL